MTDRELSKKAESAARRLSIYASALPSLGRAGTGGRVRRFLRKIVTEFQIFDFSLERAHKAGSPQASSRAKRLSQKG